jgi:photosystem II stability/assembly factor-like uncharacterized protein
MMDTGWKSLMARKIEVCAALLALLLSTAAWASGPWTAFGPDGGDARRIAPDPHDHSHLFLGAANGWIYESHNSGASWTRLSQVGKRDDLVLDSIVVDPQNPKHLVVGAWVIDHPDGGLFFSWDGGATWTNQAELRGESVRSLAASTSDPKMMVAGTLRGVFRSSDGGQRWKRISPRDDNEIHDVQSVAIDPRDPNVIFAGTWHLPWKTTDGGEHWTNIGVKEGIIEDSDVFSIILDPVNPNTMFASACSGIYKSENAGLAFEKIKGIPSSARRTRRLLQDPSHPDTVFAGTTEGLYRSDDAGKTWQRTTGPEIIVNDVTIDLGDSRHVLIATDRGGVLASDDGGDSFHSSNVGFSARQVTALKRDSNHPDTLFAGVVNDKNWGGVFQSDNGGQNWTQRSAGLEGRDVFSLGQAPDGTMIAGTSHGLFRLGAMDDAWTRVTAAPGAPAPRGTVERNPKRPGVAGPKLGSPKAAFAAARTTAKTQKKPIKLTPAQLKAQQVAARKRNAILAAKPAPTAPAAPATDHIFDGSVYAIATAGDDLLATTSIGLLTSQDNGVTWTAGGPEGSSAWRFLAASKRHVVAASLRSVEISNDGGLLWEPMKLPQILTQISAVSVEPSGEVWVGGREGVFVSSNGGNTWAIPEGLTLNAINSIFYDEATDRVSITTSSNRSLIFTVLLPGKQVNWTDTGWNLRFARPVGDHFIAATLFDGVVVQPHTTAQPAGAPAPAQAAVIAPEPSAAQTKQD